MDDRLQALLTLLSMQERICEATVSIFKCFYRLDLQQFPGPAALLVNGHLDFFHFETESK